MAIRVIYLELHPAVCFHITKIPMSSLFSKLSFHAGEKEVFSSREAETVQYIRGRDSIHLDRICLLNTPLHSPLCLSGPIFLLEDSLIFL